MLQRIGAVHRDEMFRAFNMGIGFILVVGQGQADAVLAALKRQRERAYVIGEVTRSSRGTANRVMLG